MSPSLRRLARVLAERSWKWLKFGRSGTSVHQRLDPRGERVLGASSPPSRNRVLDLARDLHEHADQMRDVAARVVDVRLQQHRVARRLVELDVVLGWPAGP